MNPRMHQQAPYLSTLDRVIYHKPPYVWAKVRQSVTNRQRDRIGKSRVETLSRSGAHQHRLKENSIQPLNIIETRSLH